MIRKWSLLFVWRLILREESQDHFSPVNTAVSSVSWLPFLQGTVYSADKLYPLCLPSDDACAMLLLQLGRFFFVFACLVEEKMSGQWSREFHRKFDFKHLLLFPGLGSLILPVIQSLRTLNEENIFKSIGKKLSFSWKLHKGLYNEDKVKQGTWKSLLFALNL